MWQYQRTDELYHWGVLGMKWGRRKQYKQSIISAKQRYKNRNIKIQERYDKTEANIESGYRRGQNLSKADQRLELANDTRARNGWAKSKATYKADRARAKNAYKSGVAKDKANYKANYKQLKENDNAADKLLYSSYTRKQAAKYMTFNNMTMAEARKKAKTNAWRNTAIISGLALAKIGTDYIRNRNT